MGATPSIFEPGPTLEEREKIWIEAMKAKGHTPILDEDGEVDMRVLDDDENFHNGPGCATCRECWCWLCLKPDKIPSCKTQS
jgi:hypothetical protein